MKRLKGFGAGFLAASLLVSTTFVHADTITKALEVVTNKVNVFMNGKEVAKAGEVYTLSDGTEVPASIVYEGTTYVPVRKLSEVLGKAIEWDGNTKTVVIKDVSPSEVTVMTIGDTQVMLSELNLYLEMVKRQYEQYFGKEVWTQSLGAEESAVDMAINNAIKMAYELTLVDIVAKEKGISLSEESMKNLETDIQQYASEFADLEKGITEDVIRLTMEKNQIRSDLYTEVTKDYEATEEEINDLLKANPSYVDYTEKGYAYYADQVRARHILFSTMDENRQPLSDEKKAEVKVKAEEVLAKIKAGEDFVELVKAHSEDPGSVDNGGEYTFPRKQMVEAFEEAVFALEEGAVSELVETQYGYHIIKLEEKIPATEEAIEAIKAQEQQLRDQATNQLKEKEFLRLLNEWMEAHPQVIKQEVIDTITLP